MFHPLAGQVAKEGNHADERHVEGEGVDGRVGGGVFAVDLLAMTHGVGRAGHALVEGVAAIAQQTETIA